MVAEASAMVEEASAMVEEASDEEDEAVEEVSTKHDPLGEWEGSCKYVQTVWSWSLQKSSK
jgi:hypothetical protein